MHHQPTALDEYAWPTCTAGPATGPHSHELWEDELDRLVCRPCETRTATRLAELPDLFATLNKTAMLMKGASHSSGSTSGTRTPPIPPRLDVLNLVAPGGAAAKLAAIEDAWRKAFGRRIAPWAGNPAQAVPVHASFLAINLRTACEGYESIGQDINTLRSLHSQCKALVEDKPRSGQVKIGLCPVPVDGGTCATQLTATTRSFKTQCPTCGTTWEGEYEWKTLVNAQKHARAEVVGAAA